MRITKTELYDRYYSVYPDKANLYKEDKEMPNHCYNKVTFYSSGNDTDETRNQMRDIKQMFDEESIFTQIIPEPDWPNTPNKNGELPVKHEDPWLTYRWSDGRLVDRWYDWRVQNWDTKWDAYDVEVTDDDPDQFEVTFNTAWSPPEAICSALREQYPDLAISWFYDEPGCELAGYL